MPTRPRTTPKRYKLKKAMLLLSSGAVMFSAASCAQTATIATGFFSSITAGGVLLLISRILND